jgi:hypothetical protein
LADAAFFIEIDPVHWIKDLKLLEMQGTFRE